MTLQRMEGFIKQQSEVMGETAIKPSTLLSPNIEKVRLHSPVIDELTTTNKEFLDPDAYDVIFKKENEDKRILKAIADERDMVRSNSVGNSLQIVRLIVEVRTLCDVHEAIRDAVRLANLHHCPVELEFNGAIIKVCQGDSPEKLIDRYMEDFNRSHGRSETRL